MGADGKPRELHIQKALDVTELRQSDVPYGNIGEIEQLSFGIKRHLSSCEYFDVCYYDLTGKTEFHSNDRFISLLVIEGEITVSYYGGDISAKKGTDVFIPKGLSVSVCGNAEIICSECK